MLKRLDRQGARERNIKQYARQTDVINCNYMALARNKNDFCILSLIS